LDSPIRVYHIGDPTREGNLFWFFLKPKIQIEPHCGIAPNDSPTYGYLNLLVRNRGRTSVDNCEILISIPEKGSNFEDMRLHWHDPRPEKTTDDPIFRFPPMIGRTVTNIFEFQNDKASTIIKTHQNRDIVLEKDKPYTFIISITGEEPPTIKTIKLKICIRDWNHIEVKRITRRFWVSKYICNENPIQTPTSNSTHPSPDT